MREYKEARDLAQRNAAMQRLSIDKGFNKSPLNHGQCDVGVEGITVKLIDYPDETRLKQTLAKMVTATTGADINQQIDPGVAEELFKGGLQTGLDAGVLVFEISGCDRALTHELVRTSAARFHQQSMRHTDMGDDFNVRQSPTIYHSRQEVDISGFPALARAVGTGCITDPNKALPYTIFTTAIKVARQAYAALKRADIPYQDARNVCPIGTQTYIIATYPIKVFLDTYAYRACNMMMWEIVWLFREMGRLVVARFPWMEPYIKIGCTKTKRCTFQGWEATADQCDGGGIGEPFVWVGDRTFKSDRFGS